MFHVKDDFKPGAPVSAVGARWFNKVGAFLNNICGGRGIKVTRSDSPAAGAPVIIELEDDVIVPSTATGTPTDMTDATDDDGTDADEKQVVWAAGGENGVDIDVYMRMKWKSGKWRAFAGTLKFSKDGLLVAAVRKNGYKEV